MEEDRWSFQVRYWKMLWQARFWSPECIFFPAYLAICYIPDCNCIMSDDKRDCIFSTAMANFSNRCYSSAREHSTFAFASFNKCCHLLVSSRLFGALVDREKSIGEHYFVPYLLHLPGGQMGTPKRLGPVKINKSMTQHATSLRTRNP